MRILGVSRGAIEVLIALNAMFFIITLAKGGWVYSNLALTPNKIFTQPWILLTSMFVHDGFQHIFFNMLALFFFGMYLERLVGESEFLRIYFLGGLFASLSYVATSFVFNTPPPNVPAVGASGAIFAVMGALVVLRPKLTIMWNFLIPMPLYVWAILYALYALPAMFTVMGHVAYNAHIGGLIAGLIYGNWLKNKTPPSGYGYHFGAGY